MRLLLPPWHEIPDMRLGRRSESGNEISRVTLAAKMSATGISTASLQMRLPGDGRFSSIFTSTIIAGALVDVVALSTIIYITFHWSGSSFRE